MPTTLRLALLLVLVVAAERGVELVLSRRHLRRARARGGVEAEGRGFYALMVATHVALLAAIPLEVALGGRRFVPALGWPMLLLAGAAMALRYWAIVTLGERWNTRVVVVPGEAAVTGGPYRFVRHPNYVAVIVEMVALPLAVSAAWTAVVFSLANAALLARRIAHEEAALARHADYDARLGDRPRLLPGARGAR